MLIEVDLPEDDGTDPVKLMDLAEHERSGELDPRELDGGADDDGDVMAAGAPGGGTAVPQASQGPKKGFLGRLLGG